jgi:hypothetical protein
MIAAERGFITAHEYKLDGLTTIPQHLRDVLETYTSGYRTGRVIGGQISRQIRDAERDLIASAERLGELAAIERDAISEEERAETWRQVKLARKAETKQQEGASI